MFKKLIQLFDQLEDHRVTGRIKYPLRLILLIVVVGLMRKGAAWKDYHMHAEAEKEKLKVFFPGLEVLPHVDTIARTTKRLIPGDLNEWFKHFIISNQEFLFGGNAVSGDTDFEKYRA
ncbi:MAG: transposase family protein, partial [Deltaproteobacteria bacterium]|nr:transposase family protein [Deltaproteobacteria bacterium]